MQADKSRKSSSCYGRHFRRGGTQRAGLERIKRDPKGEDTQATVIVLVRTQ